MNIATALTRMAERILVVDDNVVTLRTLSSFLELEGYTVAVATDGIEALAKLQSHSYNAVLSDVKMPRMNGFELTKHITSEFAATPVILMTADSVEEPDRLALRIGAKRLLLKPLKLDHLVTVIREVLASENHNHRVSMIDSARRGNSPGLRQFVTANIPGHGARVKSIRA